MIVWVRFYNLSHVSGGLDQSAKIVSLPKPVKGVRGLFPVAQLPRGEASAFESWWWDALRRTFTISPGALAIGLHVEVPRPFVRRDSIGLEVVDRVLLGTLTVLASNR